MKKKYVAFMIGLCLCASAVVAAPVRTYATGVDMADDELEEIRQQTMEIRVVQTIQARQVHRQLSQNHLTAACQDLEFHREH